MWDSRAHTLRIRQTRRTLGNGTEYSVALILGVLIYHAYVSARGYSKRQKVTQFPLIWLVPFFGALLAHFVLYTTHWRSQRRLTPSLSATKGARYDPRSEVRRNAEPRGISAAVRASAA